MSAPKPVIIAGGGPVGLIVALILGRAGVKVTLFDSGNIVYSHPRAATIHAATLDILDDLGVYQRIEPQGVICPFVNYYDGKELLASFDYGLIKDEVRHPWVLQCEQDKLSRTVYAMVQQQPSVEVRTETPVIGCSQSGRRRGAASRRLSGRRRRRALDHPQGNRCRVRGLHLSGKIHDHRYAV
jgi:3-(3-hydroxy-phenyl)propionate hydroxylase